jgi:hypothetical protein
MAWPASLAIFLNREVQISSELFHSRTPVSSGFPRANDCLRNDVPGEVRVDAFADVRCGELTSRSVVEYQALKLDDASEMIRSTTLSQTVMFSRDVARHPIIQSKIPSWTNHER